MKQTITIVSNCYKLSVNISRSIQKTSLKQSTIFSLTSWPVDPVHLQRFSTCLETMKYTCKICMWQLWQVQPSVGWKSCLNYRWIEYEYLNILYLSDSPCIFWMKHLSFVEFCAVNLSHLSLWRPQRLSPSRTSGPWVQRSIIHHHSIFDILLIVWFCNLRMSYFLINTYWLTDDTSPDALSHSPTNLLILMTISYNIYQYLINIYKHI